MTAEAEAPQNLSPAQAEASQAKDAVIPDYRTHTRGGMTASEAAIAWAVVRFEGDVESCGCLQGVAGERIRAAVEPVCEMSESERFQLTERWRDADRRWDRLDWLLDGVGPIGLSALIAVGDERWAGAYEQVRASAPGRRRPWCKANTRTRRAVEWLATEHVRARIEVRRPELRARTGFDLEVLAESSAEELGVFIRQIGIYQVADLCHRQSRRSLVRLRQRVVAPARPWFDHCITKCEHDSSDLARARLRDLFSVVRRQSGDMHNYLLHIGLYSIALACSARFGEKIRRLLPKLSAQIATELSRYHQIALAKPEALTWYHERQMDLLITRLRDFQTRQQEVLADSTLDTPQNDGSTSKKEAP